jgi:uncharacterized protein YeaO (DUF488 family)
MAAFGLFCVAYRLILVRPRADGAPGSAEDGVMNARINVKRVYEPPAPADGRRILVERLWPRGIRKADLVLERWAKELGASDGLRRWYGHSPEKWPEFQRRYRVELLQHPEHWEWVADLARHEPVTLLFSARDPLRNNAVALRLFLLEQLVGSDS